TLKPILFEMIDSIGGDCIKKQDRVLIKPNLLLPAKPEKAILTHPLVVRVVAEYIQSKGGYAQISDSPATGSKVFPSTFQGFWVIVVQVVQPLSSALGLKGMLYKQTCFLSR
ncbi:MAG TPA: DUF362 domain-containing protein, partial [Anaerolineae bacterium]|nr:DUF362 domain-containing protein [Anaerolineae bacterium]